MRDRALVVIDIADDPAAATGGGPRRRPDRGQPTSRLHRALVGAGLAAMGTGQQPALVHRLVWRVDADTVQLLVTDAPRTGDDDSTRDRRPRARHAAEAAGHAAAGDLPSGTRGDRPRGTAGDPPRGTAGHVPRGTERDLASGTTLLRIPRGSVDPEWIAAARGPQPTVLVAGLGIGLERGDTVRDVLARVEATAQRGRLVGGRVGLARGAPDGSAGEGRPRRTGGTGARADARAGVVMAAGHGARPRTGTRPRGDVGTERWPSTAARLGVLGVAAVVVAAMVGQTVVGSPSDDPGPTPPRPTAAVAAGLGSAEPPAPAAATATPAPVPGTPAPWVVAGPDGAPVRSVIDGPADEVAAAGLTWPILEEVDGSYHVATHCNRNAWVSAADVERPDVARGDGLGGAVIVLDAGHGGIDAGVPSSTGLLESDLNLVVAERLQALLERSNDIDPDTGAVTPGDEHPPVAAVLMTRDAQDAKGGNQRTALVFRGRLATLVDADALLSIHHNAGDVETFSDPPVEVFYSVDDDASPRLAALVVEELRRSFAPLADTWRGATMAGAIGRRGTDGNDYYTVLEEGQVPAVISEALYLSDPAAAALAATEEFQRAEAEALYRALVRFLDTEETGGEVDAATAYPSGNVEPYDYSRCQLAVDEDAG